MERKEVMQRVVEAVREYAPDVQIEEETIISGANSNIGLNSLDFISVIVSLEDAYGIRIPEEDMLSRKLGRASNLVTYILEKTKNG